jgi:hypothetical protein
MTWRTWTRLLPVFEAGKTSTSKGHVAAQQQVTVLILLFSVLCAATCRARAHVAARMLPKVGGAGPQLQQGGWWQLLLCTPFAQVVDATWQLLFICCLKSGMVALNRYSAAAPGESTFSPAAHLPAALAATGRPRECFPKLEELDLSFNRVRVMGGGSAGSYCCIRSERERYSACCEVPCSKLFWSAA